MNHKVFKKAKNNNWFVILTPTKPVPNDWEIQFSHTIEKQIGGQLQAGFVLTDIFQDTNGTGKLHEFNVPTFYATRAVKPL
ncbi:hypothetical protein EQM05_00920 [Clostridium sp. JN-9]|nr:hypothetical protein EQM05_00920 [Clostridium sp. JN-9]